MGLYSMCCMLKDRGRGCDMSMASDSRSRAMKQKWLLRVSISEQLGPCQVRAEKARVQETSDTDFASQCTPFCSNEE